MSDEMTQKTETILAPFNPLVAKLQELKKRNRELAFDYRTPEGNKSARSQVYVLRQFKSDIAAVHKAVKSDILTLGRAMDAKKNELVAEVEEEINFHNDPILEIEREQAAIEAEEQRKIQEQKDAEELALREAEEKRRRELEEKERELAEREAKVRAEKEAIERKEREARIAAEAEQRARERAKLELRQAEERRKRDLEAAEQRRILDLKEAEERIKRDQAEREAAEQRRIAAEKAEQERLAEIERKRIEDIDHRNRIQYELNNILMEYGVGDREVAQNIVEAIAKGKIISLKIIY